jgi:hypothetical protein
MDHLACFPSVRRVLLLQPPHLPVLRATRDGIAHWAQRRDEVDASRLADLALRDPLMCLRTLLHTAITFRHRLASPVQTVTAALVLTGIEPFFRAFADLPVLEDRLAHEPRALAGALAAVDRARAASRLAAAFAVHRQDGDAELLHQAALLHDFAGLLLWTEAPDAALQIAELQRRDPTLRSADAQKAVLGCTVESLGHKLVESWDVADAVREAARAVDENGPGARGVRLAVQIARHLEGGWHNPALPDDMQEAGALLNLPAAGAATLVRGAL